MCRSFATVLQVVAVISAFFYTVFCQNLSCFCEVQLVNPKVRVALLLMTAEVVCASKRPTSVSDLQPSGARAPAA